MQINQGCLQACYNIVTALSQHCHPLSPYCNNLIFETVTTLSQGCDIVIKVLKFNSLYGTCVYILIQGTP